MRAGTNEPDIAAVMADARCRIATAKIAEFERQCFRFGDLVGQRLITPAVCADFLIEVAWANALPMIFGEEFVEWIVLDGLDRGRQ